MKTPIIRFVKPNDLVQLVHLCELHANFEKSEYNSKHKAVLLKEALFKENPDLYCLVIDSGENNLIGYATYMKQYSTWDASFYIYMDCLFLKSESRGFGLGEKLMNQIKKEAVLLHCSIIQWQTPKFNTRAIKFYNRIGGVSKDKERYFLNTNK